MLEKVHSSFETLKLVDWNHKHYISWMEWEASLKWLKLVSSVNNFASTPSFYCNSSKSTLQIVERPGGCTTERFQNFTIKIIIGI